MFCQTFLLDKSVVKDDNLYRMFKYAYLKGRKDYIEGVEVFEEEKGFKN